MNYKQNESGYYCFHKIIPVFLVVIAGTSDAYTYVARGNVFSCIQICNLVLLGIHLTNFYISDMLKYLIPILLFVFGIFVSEIVRAANKNAKSIYVKSVFQVGVIAFVFVGFIPSFLNWLANGILSFLCGYCLKLIPQEFVAANLRIKCLKHVFLILAYIMGTFIGALLTLHLGLHAAFGLSGITFLTGVILFQIYKYQN